MNNYIQQAKDLAADSVREIINDWMTCGGNLDEMLDDYAAQLADNKCIWTKDNRDLVRALEDCGDVDAYMDFVYGDQPRDEENTAIAYCFWSQHIAEELQAAFEAHEQAEG